VRFRWGHGGDGETRVEGGRGVEIILYLYPC